VRQRAHAARSDILRGILLMCLGMPVFPFMNAAVKLLTSHYPVMQIVWARFTGHLIIMLIVFWPRYGRRLLATRQRSQRSRSAAVAGLGGRLRALSDCHALACCL
jgi:hypothetical protein